MALTTCYPMSYKRYPSFNTPPTHNPAVRHLTQALATETGARSVQTPEQVLKDSLGCNTPPFRRQNAKDLAPM
jgi:hypothetical protein